MKPAPYYQQNDITIYHGDCLDILPRLPGACVDFVLTDPPYLVGYRGRWDSEQHMIVGDQDPSWLRPAFAEVWRVLRPDTCCVSFYGWPHSDLFVGIWKELGFRPVSHLAFVKNVWALGRFTRGQHETAYLLAKGNPPVPKQGIADVIEWQREQEAFHPNQKPVGALYPLLTAYAREGGTVLDPLCAAAHKGSCVAQSIMWRPASASSMVLVKLLRWTPHNGPCSTGSSRTP